MKCRYCQEDIKFTNSHLHSSNLRNHLTFKHPEKFSVPEKAKVPKIDDYFTGHKSSLPSLPALDRQTLAVCCSAHPLPFNFIEDKVFQWAYNCPVKDRRRISIRVTELARDWREKICGSFPGKFFTILLDGWTNPVTRQSHMCYMLCDRNKLVYWKSVVVEDKRAQNLFEILELTIAELKDAGANVTAVIGDNIQSSLKLLNNNCPEILVGGCAAHILNLLVSDIFKAIPTVQATLTLVDGFVRDKLVSRYVQTRWNSRYQAILSAGEKKLFNSTQEPLFEQTRQILKEVSMQIDVVQKDTSCVIDFATAFAKIRNSWEKNMTLSRETRNDLEKQWSKRLQMFTCSIIGNVCNYFKDFLFDNETSSIFTSPADILAVQTWALHVLPSTNLEVFKAEATEIEDVKNLGQPVVPANFRIHKTLANLILKVVVSEACVERAFSRHKLFHSNLRANLKAEKLDEQLFLRYNFQNMIDTASTVNQSHGESDDDDDFLPFE